MSSKIKVSPKIDNNSNKLSCNPVNNISVVVRPDAQHKFRKDNPTDAQDTVLYPSVGEAGRTTFVKPLYEPPNYKTRDINLDEEAETSGYTQATTTDYSCEYLSLKEQYTSLKKAYDTLESEKHKLENQNEALNIIIGIMQDNPTYVNKLILADDTQLCSLLMLLCDGAEDITIDADELSTCFAKSYRSVNAIYVTVTNSTSGASETKNLKYEYSDVVKYMKELGINLKVVW